MRLSTLNRTSARERKCAHSKGRSHGNLHLLATFTDQVIRKVKDHPGGRFGGPGRHVDGGLVMGN
jgi:hypothetical protein